MSDTIVSIVGTRPELIRLSCIIPKLDKYSKHILVHTGQNYTDSLNGVFFRELGIRNPDYNLEVKEDSFGKQIGQIISKTEEVLLKEKPDKVLILGDTNSGLSAIVAKRMGIPVYHMEAGNRCFSAEVPEETNRKIIDHCSTVFMPYTQRSKEHLLAEGIPNQNIFVIGNPIYEVISKYENEIQNSKILKTLDLKPQEYFLVTMHRQENVDDKDNLTHIVNFINQIAHTYTIPIIISLHPRTKEKLKLFRVYFDEDLIKVLEPMGYFDFTKLMKNCRCFISDSGTAIEEACIFRVPCVTIRNSCERLETIECGSNILSGIDENMMDKLNIALNEYNVWYPPSDYTVKNVSERVVKIMLGK